MNTGSLRKLDKLIDVAMGFYVVFIVLIVLILCYLADLATIE